MVDLCAKNTRKFGKQTPPLCIFWTVWRVRKRIVFNIDVFFIQRLKSSFVCFLWLKTKLFIDDGPQTLVSFFDWLGSC